MCFLELGARRWAIGMETGPLGPQGAAAGSGSLRVTGTVPCSFRRWDLPLLKFCARANPLGRNQNWLLAQTFQLQGKGIVR